jgi:hypothetical protein
MRRLEFWPDYGGVLLHEAGTAVALDGLGLPDHLVEQAAAWVGEYDDARLDPDTRDAAWITAGRSLFRRLRAELRDRGTEIVDWEGYWDDPGTNDPGA